jgi:hypothetical protein
MSPEQARHILSNKIAVHLDIKRDQFDNSLKSLPGFLYIARDDMRHFMLFNPDSIHDIKNYFKYRLRQGLVDKKCYGISFIDDEIRSIAIVSDIELIRIKRVLEENHRYDILMKIF